MRVRVLTGERFGQWLGLGWEPLGYECRMEWGDIGDFRFGFFLLLFSDSEAKHRENYARYMQAATVAAQDAEVEIHVIGIEDASVTIKVGCPEDEPEYSEIMRVNFEVARGSDEEVKKAIEAERLLDMAGSPWVKDGRGYFQTFMPCGIGIDLEEGTILTFPLRPRIGMPYPGDEEEVARAIYPTDTPTASELLEALRSD